MVKRANGVEAPDTGIADAYMERAKRAKDINFSRAYVDIKRENAAEDLDIDAANTDLERADRVEDPDTG